TPNEQAEQVAEPALSVTGKPLQRRSWTPWLAGPAIVMLLFNLLQNWQIQQDAVAANPFADTSLWQPILESRLPVLILVGDYYIMGEVDDSGNISRMVREFDINSRQD